ncbi:bifunctional diguanylate cyclase/phosphodiesterase [Thiomicrospira sp.]|uniref:GGDEF domain-containing protein n=1 Tax=Thiomicrospira sp. TaxID=935 RepID=UPI002F9424D1
MATTQNLCAQFKMDRLEMDKIADTMLDNLSSKQLGLELSSIFRNRNLTALFQPIIDLKTRQIYGHEALIRGPVNSSLHSPLDLFQAAEKSGCLFEMDWLARSTAIASFQQQQSQDLLFINITVNSIMARGHRQGMTLDCLHELGVPVDKVVIEITELQPVEDFNLFIESINHYRKMGFKVALDDLGGGYNGLRLWSELRPDFVKIDKHFVLGIAQSKDKRHFIESIKTLAEGLNTKLVAEGIETEEDLRVIEDIGIDYVQGFLFRRPEAQLKSQLCYEWANTRLNPTLHDYSNELAAILIQTESVEPLSPVHWVSQLLHKNNHLDFIPVVENKTVLGMVWRRELMDLLAQRYGHDLHHRKPISKLMDRQPIVVDIHTPVETLSRLITDHKNSHRGDAFIITKNNQYAGCGRFLDLLRLITDLKIRNAQYANPLSGLPGNVPIQKHLQNLIHQKRGFCVFYIDIDHFKAYNDYYSYEQGDDVIRMVSHLVQNTAQRADDFIGHIGGDDFILIRTKTDSFADTCDSLLDQFNTQVKSLYKEEDIRNGGIQSQNRAGQIQRFPLMSLSIGVLVVPPGLIEHQQKLASLATKAKKQAKHSGGNTWALLNALDA